MSPQTHTHTHTDLHTHKHIYRKTKQEKIERDMQTYYAHKRSEGYILKYLLFITKLPSAYLQLTSLNWEITMVNLQLARVN